MSHTAEIYDITKPKPDNHCIFCGGTGFIWKCDDYGDNWEECRSCFGRGTETKRRLLQAWSKYSEDSHD